MVCKLKILTKYSGLWQNVNKTELISWIFRRNCGEMAHTTDEYSTAGVCGSGSQIVYAWAMDAPSLTLPKGKA